MISIRCYHLVSFNLSCIFQIFSVLITQPFIFEILSMTIYFYVQFFCTSCMDAMPCKAGHCLFLMAKRAQPSQAKLLINEVIMTQA